MKRKLNAYGMKAKWKWIGNGMEMEWNGMEWK